MLDRVERTQLHAAVAAGLDGQAGRSTRQSVRRQAARLAWHYEMGWADARGCPRAGRRGAPGHAVSALREALDRFYHGLALLANVPRSKERTEVTRLLEMARLGPEHSLEGLGSAGLQRALARAKEAFGAQLGETPVGEAPIGDASTSQAAAGGAEGRPTLMIMLAETQRLMATGQLEDALASAERLRAGAAQRGEEDLVACGHLYLGLTHHHMGSLRESDRHLQSALGRATPEWPAGLPAATGISLAPGALGYSALNRWFLGNPEEALAASREAVRVAVEHRDAYGEALAAATGANLRLWLRDPAAFAEQSRRCHRVCAQHGLSWWRSYAEVLLGRVEIASGGPDEVAGIERMATGLAEWQAGGMAVGSDALALILADGCLAAAGRTPPGGAPAASKLLATGLAAIDALLGPPKVPCGDGYLAERLRMRGRIAAGARWAGRGRRGAGLFRAGAGARAGEGCAGVGTAGGDEPGPGTRPCEHGAAEAGVYRGAGRGPCLPAQHLRAFHRGV